MEKIEIRTRRKKEVLDITDETGKALARASRKDGLAHLFLLHTTAALTLADLDPGTDLDLLDAFETLVPKLNYRHPHNPGHVSDHILSALIGTSLCIAVESGRPLLGTWQRIVLIEFDGPRRREVAVSFIAES